MPQRRNRHALLLQLLLLPLLALPSLAEATSAGRFDSRGGDGRGATAADNPDNAACGDAYTQRSVAALALPPKAGFGALFVAHHSDGAQHAHFLAEALTSAQSYRRASPRPSLTLLLSRVRGGGELKRASRGRRAAPTRAHGSH
jgi:hypothetical protein